MFRAFACGVAVACGLVVTGPAGAAPVDEPAPVPLVRSAPERETSGEDGWWQLIESRAIDEAPEPLDPVERSAREAKNLRYDEPDGRDLTTLEPGTCMETIACSGGGLRRALPEGPYGTVVLGTVRAVQPYLSSSRTAIYTEYELEVEEVFRSTGGHVQIFDRTVAVDRMGGVLRRRSGQIISWGFSGSMIPHTLDLNGRYVIFLREVHDGNDLMLGTVFELRDGQTYMLWERPEGDRLVGTISGEDPSMSDEAAFLQAVRAMW